MSFPTIPHIFKLTMTSKANPIPLKYQNEIYANGLRNQRPAITADYLKWESQAEGVLSAEAKGYVWGSAGTRETYDNNLREFKKWGIIPNRLVPSGFTSLKTTLFGEEYDYPIAIAPIGVQRLFHRDAETAVATAARKENVTYILSSATCTSIENVAAANGDDASRWFQLYWPSNDHNDITASLLSRAKSSGYKVLVVTVDAQIVGWRPSDLDNGFSPFIRPDNIGVEIGFSDPVFQKYYQDKSGHSVDDNLGAAAAEWMRVAFPGPAHSWEDIKFLQQHWDGPIVIKGIQSVADARRAVEVGVQGIVVSNHGGREQDGGVASLAMLPEIVDAVGDKLEIIFDSGVRSGADIVKALALGAKMVLIGRPYIYGLALGGEDGVRHVLKCFLADLQLTLHLSGVPSISPDHLNRSLLRRTDL